MKAVKKLSQNYDESVRQHKKLSKSCLHFFLPEYTVENVLAKLQALTAGKWFASKFFCKYPWDIYLGSSSHFTLAYLWEITLTYFRMLKNYACGRKISITVILTFRLPTRNSFSSRLTVFRASSLSTLNKKKRFS